MIPSLGLVVDPLGNNNPLAREGANVTRTYMGRIVAAIPTATRDYWRPERVRFRRKCQFAVSPCARQQLLRHPRDHKGSEG